MSQASVIFSLDSVGPSSCLDACIWTEWLSVRLISNFIYAYLDLKELNLYLYGWMLGCCVMRLTKI